MGRKTIILGIGLLVLIAGAATYIVATKKENNSLQNDSASSQNSQEIITQEATPLGPGRYEEYSAEAVAAEKTASRLLFFHASWCPQCRELDASIRSTSLPDGVVIYKVDYDSHQALRQKYGVTLQTTVVKIDTEGNKVKSFVAYSEPTFASVQRELFP